MTDAVTKNSESDVNVTQTHSGVSESATIGQRDYVYLRPLVDICEDEKGIVLTADLPSVDNSQVKIEIDSDTLKIEADADADLVGSRAAKYRRSFTLSRELDSNAIEARLEQGVLTLAIPKHAEVLPRRVEVKAA